MKRPLVPSPVASSSSSLFGISGSLQNGDSSTLSRSRKSVAYLALPHLVPRCCVSFGMTSLSRLGVIKLACAVMYPSAAPKLRFVQMFTSCIDQPCMRLFFALSAAMTFVVMGADCTKTCANSSSSTQATGFRVDDVHVDWYRSRHGKEIDRSMVLPVFKVLQGHPEAGALWEQYINKSLDDLDTVYTSHERSIYQGMINGKVDLRRALYFSRRSRSSEHGTLE
jgi:hypothetical protein